MRSTAILLLTAPLAWAQVALYTVSPEHRLGAQFNLGQVPEGDALTVRFQIRNLGPTIARVTQLSVAGTGFSLSDPPALPRSLGTGGGLDFTVRFEPSGPGAYSASLQSDGISMILQATATPAPAVAIQEGGTWRTLVWGSTVDFGDVERGWEGRRRFLLSGRGGEPPPPVEVAVAGNGFTLVRQPGQVTEFEVVSRPAAAEVLAGTLAVGDRRFNLKATGVEPALPRPEIAIELAEPRSARQGRVAVRLASPSRSRASGELRLAFEPAPGLGADPAVVLASGSRVAPFTVEEGDTAVRFGDRTAVDFQTGGTAGTLVFTAAAGAWQERATVTVAPAVPVVSSSRTLRAASSLEVVIGGLDNTRSAAQLAFTFYDLDGKVINPGAIRVDAGPAFRQYFDSSGLGGAFLLRAVFPVTGAITRIGAVEVEIANAPGAARTGRLPF